VDNAAALDIVVTDGPKVIGLTRGRGSTLTLTFDSPLDPASAQAKGHFRLELVTTRGNRPLKVVRKIGLKSVRYDPVGSTVILTTAAPLAASRRYRLTVDGHSSAALTSPAGVRLDGAGSGHPGSDYVATIGGQRETVGRVVVRG
jgi:hypothetical protein